MGSILGLKLNEYGIPPHIFFAPDFRASFTGLILLWFSCITVIWLQICPRVSAFFPANEKRQSLYIFSIETDAFEWWEKALKGKA